MRLQVAFDERPGTVITEIFTALEDELLAGFKRSLTSLEVCAHACARLAFCTRQGPQTAAYLDRIAQYRALVADAATELP